MSKYLIRKKSLKLNVFCFLLIFSSCAPRNDEKLSVRYREIMKPAIDEKNKPGASVSFDGEVEPELPDFKANNSNFFGVDVNRNGVRDDVEIWINRSIKDSNVRKSLKEFVRYLELEVGERDSIKSLKFFRKKLEAEKCFDYVAIHENQKGLTAFANMQAVFFNSVYRIKYSPRPAGYGDIEDLNLPPDHYCSFKIQNLEELKKAHLKR